MFSDSANRLAQRRLFRLDINEDFEQQDPDEVIAAEMYLGPSKATDPDHLVYTHLKYV